MDELTRKTIETYDATAEAYTANVARLHPTGPGKEFLLHVREGKTILDLGCASGRDAFIFTEEGRDVVGVDLSSRMLDIARLQAPKAYFANMDMRQLGFPDNSFDGIWASASLLHVPKADMPTVANEMYRVLRKNGAIFVEVKEGEGEQMVEDERYGNMPKFFSYYQMEEIMKHLNRFCIEQLKYAPIDHSYKTHDCIRLIGWK